MEWDVIFIYLFIYFVNVIVANAIIVSKSSIMWSIKSWAHIEVTLDD